MTDRSRVPEIVALYWIAKIASTTFGETAADMASMTFDLGYIATTLIFFGIFAALLAAKLRVGGYHPALYWGVFTASAVAGTGLSDFLDRTAGLGYAGGAGVLVVALMAVLAVWRRVEGSLAVEGLTTARAEGLYWLAFLVANTLGTAAGDYLADDLELGFAASAGAIGGVLVALALLQRLTKAPRLVLFWLAFVLTRPFGATFGDLLTKGADEGGLGVGTIGASALFLAILVLAVRQEHRRHRAA
ncbi:MAG: hypothetical protein H6706_19735 [Myxococcales bacterium]|nr:hypothetical protein [Myxococcales bacterium]